MDKGDISFMYINALSASLSQKRFQLGRENHNPCSPPIWICMAKLTYLRRLLAIGGENRITTYDALVRKTSLQIGDDFTGSICAHEAVGKENG
ncbi:hypothetical protein FPZ24_02110 [Sphingomonas panacisoli]|uniref:Uncharacterized protein n=1 Tax=Sphingomonas panacisoli TaxID=1813879 RepID=A0A5B8LE64_9SPHN|nr:hypothetical protein [Sphingomonas panacisoli]QDZ06417.1 hypothetical protein FPZ24_02110 [Sphingomonas panacisoli]